MSDSKSTTPVLVLVAVLALLAGLGIGYFAMTTTCSQAPAAVPATAQQPPAVPAVDAAVVGDKVLAYLDKRLEARLAELIALEMAAAPAVRKAAKPLAAKPVRPPVKPSPAAAALKEKKIVRPTIPKDAPRPKTTVATEDDAAKETSKAALARAGKYETAAGASPAIGDSKAPVKVFIISDFQCPVCRRAAEGMHPLFDEFEKEVQFIFWQNPLDMHRKAMPTAQASMAAFRQGKFWEYHDLMFQNQRAADPGDLASHATKLGLDLKKFDADAKADDLYKKIRSDQAASEAMGARGTPAFVINGRKQVGWGSAAGVASMIKREMKEMEKLTSAGKSLEEAWGERATANSKTPEEAEAYIRHFLKGEPAVRTEAKTEEVKK